MKNVALITGASSGIGKEFARIHAKKGNDLVIVARRYDRLMELKEELVQNYKVEVHVIVSDLSDLSAPEAIFQETGNRGIVIDYLINNVGFAGHGFFHERPPKNDLQMIHVNVSSLMLLTKLYLPGMIERGRGRILNVSSVASFLPGPMQSVYYASKAFVTSFSQALSEELKDKGITVTALCPGLVNTEFVESSGMGEAKIMKFQKAVPAKRTASIRYRDMMRGKLLSFDRTIMKLLIRWLTPFIPRRTLLKISRITMER